MKLACLLLLASAPAALCQIYADVSTSMGDFTIELNHAAAPATVANFIGLAAGTRAWVDPLTGAVKNEPFYDGVTFHRVIANFMSQTGSRKGDGTDGPGYAFRDEFAGGLTHSGPHIVSMANSGPNTNGSQFFITDVAASHLDGKHTVFGMISSGQAVVDAINNVPTTAEKPNTPVVIESIRIRRVGAAAENFDEHAHSLPTVVRPQGQLRPVPGESVTWECAAAQPPGTVFRATRSTDLAGWSGVDGALVLIGLDDATRQTYSLGAFVENRAFYHLSTAFHPSASGVSSLSDRVITVRAGSLNGFLRFAFNDTGDGGEIRYIPDSGSPVIGEFETISPSLGAYHTSFIANTSLSLGGVQFVPWVKCGWDQVGEATVTGHHDTTRYVTGNWLPLDQGDCSFAR